MATKKTVKKTKPNNKANKKTNSEKTSVKTTDTKKTQVKNDAKQVNNSTGWQITAGLLLVLLILSLLVNNFNQEETTTNSLSSQDVANKTIDFINANMLQGQSTALLNTVEESGDLYLLKINIDGQDYDVYATKDGSMIFPQAISTNETTEQAEPQAQQETQNLEKSETPVVELFIMSHCPYGTQIEKGIIPVVETLGDSIDFELKFVNYAMHPTQGEVEEQLNQYCIQRDYNDKFMTYLTKFLEAGNSDDAFAQIGISQDDISACVAETDEKFDVIKNLEDEASWMNGRFPKFMIHNDENLAYGVQGSPTLVVNGAQAQAGRDAQSLLNAICGAFTTAPAECDTDLTSYGNPAPGFGFDTDGGSAAAAGCEI